VAEEGIAEMLRLYQKNPTAFRKPTRGVLKRLTDFLRKLIGLGKRYKTEDLMDAIFGGQMSTRNEGYGGLSNSYPGDPKFSSVKVPGFYLKSDRFFMNLKQDKAPVDQWVGILKNAQIKEEELNWLGLEQWMKDVAAEKKQRGEDNKITRGEILDYIRANGLDVMETVRDDSPEYLSTDEEIEFDKLDRAMFGLRQKAATKFFESVASPDEEDPYDWEAWVEDPKTTDPDAVAFRQAYKRRNELNDRRLGKNTKTRHKGTTQEGGKDYTELLMHLPGLQPQFKVDMHHAGFPNIIVAARFKTRNIEGRKSLFIEEMQSDLHQKGKKYGYNTGDLDQREEELSEQFDIVDKKFRKLTTQYQETVSRLTAYRHDLAELWAKSSEPDWEDKYREKYDEYESIVESLKKQANEERAAATTVRDGELRQLQSELGRINASRDIPDAPFKTSWDELGFKRLVRWAAENGFDEISWHAEPKSVAETEGWNHMGTFQQQLEPDGSERWVIADPNTGEVYTDVTNIVDFYTKRLKSYAGKSFRKFESGVRYEAPKTYREFSPSEVFSSVDDIGSFMANYHMPASLKKQLTKAVQIMRNQRETDIDSAFTEAGVDMGDLLNSLGEEPGMNREYDENGNPLFARWVFHISDALKKSVLTEGQPLFSAVAMPADLRPASEPQYSQTAPMGQRVPANTPPDRLREIEQKMTYNNVVPVLQRMSKFMPGSFRESYKEGVENTFIALQDRMLPVGKLIDRMKANGGFISNENDTYLRETLFTGRTDTRIADNEKNLYEPLWEAVKNLRVDRLDARRLAKLTPASQSLVDNYRDPKQAVAETFLYALHAQERNAKMRQRNPKALSKTNNPYDPQAFGSGMRDDEAQYILQWMAKQSFMPELMNISHLVQKVISSTNDIRVEGRLNPDFRKMVRKDGSPVDDYTHYVPLRSWIDEHMDQDEDALTFAKAGRGFSIRGKEDYSATGRRSLAAHIIEHAILQNAEAIVRAEKNKVGLSFYKMMQDNPTFADAIGEIVEKPMKPVYDWRTGRVKLAFDHTFLNDPSVLKVKDGLNQIYIKIKDPKIAKALGSRSSLGNAGAGAFMKMLLGLNRYLATVRTSMNPEFLVSNMMRDLGAALTNLNELQLQGVKSEVLASVIPALRGVWHTLRTGDHNTDWAKVYDEFRKVGGQTAFYGIRQLDDTVKKTTDHLTGGSTKQKILDKSGIQYVLDLVDHSNSAIENGTRLATYKVLRDKFLEMGDRNDPAHIKRSRERAAFISKNLTVNFNAGGEWKPLMNALYLFYNAGLQGSMALINPMIRSKRVRAMWAGVVIAGVLQDILMSMFGDRDDDGKLVYDKIPEYVLQHNIIIPDVIGIGDRGYFKIPMPYLMNGIYNFGRVLSRSARGEYTPSEALGSAAGTIGESLNPWGAANNFLNYVLPTILDPIAELAQNEDYASRPIAPPADPYGGATQERPSQRYWNNTNPAFVTIAQWLGDITGGEGRHIPGAMDYSPNQIEYVYDWLFAGTGQFLSRGVKLAFGDKTELSSNDVPFWRRVHGNVTSQNDVEAYIKNRDRVLMVRAELRGAIKDGDQELYKNIILEYPDEYKLAARINKIENARKKLSSKINKIRKSTRLTDAQREDMIAELKKRQNELVGQANKLFE
jgi:uncharacterized protein YukE